MRLPLLPPVNLHNLVRIADRKAVMPPIKLPLSYFGYAIMALTFGHFLFGWVSDLLFLIPIGVRIRQEYRWFRGLVNEALNPRPIPPSPDH